MEAERRVTTGTWSPVAVLQMLGIVFLLGASPLISAAQITQYCAAGDWDSDGISNLEDNCVATSNASQLDTNGDGYGNACDADLNNDDIINFIDVGLFKIDIFSTGIFDADFNGDSVVNFIDLGLMKSTFFQSPGPSYIDCPASGAEIIWNDAILRLDVSGKAIELVNRLSGENFIANPYDFVRIETDGGLVLPTHVEQDDDLVEIEFSNGDSALFQVVTAEGYSWWDLVDYSGDISAINTMRLGTLNLTGSPDDAGEYPEERKKLNFRTIDNFSVGVLPTEPNVRGYRWSTKAADKEGVTSVFDPEKSVVRDGLTAARFTAVSTLGDNTGWSVRYTTFDEPRDLSAMLRHKIWVYGDNSGANLKFQLIDRFGRALDKTRTIDFSGWKQINLNVWNWPEETFDLSQVTGLNVYFNNIPANSEVDIVIDSMRAEMDEGDGDTSLTMLQDFEDDEAPFWDALTLTAEVYEKFQLRDKNGLFSPSFAIVATPVEKMDAALESLEVVAGLPHIRLTDANENEHWGKHSPLVKNSYLFVHKLKLSDVDDVIAGAHFGGFDTVLIGTNWSQSLGSHVVDTQYFPNTDDTNGSDGLESLEEAAQLIRAAGLRVGLHVLAAGIDLDDPFVNSDPEGGPDPRIFTGESIELKTTVAANATFIPTVEAPHGFPTKDNDVYNDAGTYLQIGSEIVQYESLDVEGPDVGFVISAEGRGVLGTEAVSHDAGDNIEHLYRSFGYFLHDLDTDLSAQVADNFCRVANAVAADMVYLDGSERLQGNKPGEHWFYNAKLQGLYFDCLDNKNTLIQASSYSGYSWHYLSRQASGDINESQRFKAEIDDIVADRYAGLIRDRMPIDGGWYFAFQSPTTTDQAEYLLKNTLAYDSSVSFSLYPHTLRTHPVILPALDLVKQYDDIRIEGIDIQPYRNLLREPGREYRLTTEPTQLTRVAYTDWQTFLGSELDLIELSVDPIPEDACKLGMELRVQGTQEAIPDGSYFNSPLVIEDFATESDIISYEKSSAEGTTITQFKRIGSRPDGMTDSAFQFSAKNEGGAGHATATRTFSTALDISDPDIVGFGVWVYGLGEGGSLKIQPRSEAWHHPDEEHQDYYIANNFRGEWRYFQLPKINENLTKIKYLSLYWNYLPEGREVTIYVDDIRAITEFDPPAMRNPTLSVGDQSIAITADIIEGQRLVYFPGEGAELIQANPSDPVVVEVAGNDLLLAGPVTAQLSAEQIKSGVIVDARLLQVCQEQIDLGQ